MADFPCLPLWTDAYLADTMHLSTEEHGAYLLLLFEAWRSSTCSLPDDDKRLARITRLSSAKWKAAKPTLMALWSLDSETGEWSQKRLSAEWAKAASKKEKARESAGKRWKSDANAYANASPKHGKRMPSSNALHEPEPDPYGKPGGFPTGARAREKPKNWVERKTHSSSLDNIIDRLNEHGQPGTQSSSGIAQAPVQLLPDRRAG